MAGGGGASMAFFLETPQQLGEDMAAQAAIAEGVYNAPGAVVAAAGRAVTGAEDAAGRAAADAVNMVAPYLLAAGLLLLGLAVVRAK